jgi:hypothetical protein
VYKEYGWISWGHFFSTDRVANQLKNFLSYEEARNVLKSFEIDNHKKLRYFLKSDLRPNNFPGNPKHTYLNDGWVSWEHFFNIEKVTFLDFIEAKKFAQGLNFTNQQDWREYCKSGLKPSNIPSNPMNVYKTQGWLSMGDWLGTNNVRNSDKSYRDFYEARDFVRNLKFNNIEQWTAYCKSGKKPIDIPSYPDKPYKNKGWINWADWLGKDSFQGNSQKLTYLEARKIVQKFKLKSTKEWADFCKSGKKPSNIPNRPSAVYKDNGWNGWGDWLGTKTIANFNKTYMPFEQLKQLVKENRIGTQMQWNEFYKNLYSKENIPSNPQRTYKGKGWVNWADFLGKN